MEEINERIKSVVSQSRLSQTEFSKRLNVTQSYVSALCLGKKTPSDRTIIDICREFDISEHWLRTGKGKMHIQRSKEDELSAFVEKLLQGESDDIRRRLVWAISKLGTNELEFLNKIALRLVDEVNATASLLAEDLNGIPATQTVLGTTDQKQTVADTTGQERTEPDIPSDKKISRIAAEHKAGQEEMDAAPEIAPDVPQLDENGLTPEEAEECKRFCQETIAKRGQTEQQSASPNANAS